MDTLASPGDDTSPTETGAPVRTEEQRIFWQGLLGAAIGGRYQLERLVDFGSMGAVYASRHKSDTSPHFAVKILDPELSVRDRRYVRRFIREARILKSVDHPNIVKVFEYGRYEPPDRDATLYYYVMELIGGEGGPPLTLHRYATTRELRMEEVVYIVSQILSGLRHVHERGVIHRDLKPWNVLVDDLGNCKIVDFGLAKIPDSNLTDVDELFGSQDYIAPELYYRGAREATPAADLYAVGRIFADLVDRVDFSSTKGGVFASKAAALKYLGELLKRLVEEDPTLRFGSAKDVLNVIEEFKESTRIRTTVQPAARLAKAARLAAAGRQRWMRAVFRWVFDYGLFVAGIVLLPFVTARSVAVGALLAASLVTSKLFSALSHPPDRHPIAIVVKALTARLNRIAKMGDFRVQYYAPAAFALTGRSILRVRHVSVGHRRQYRALAFPEGVGAVGLAAKARCAVIVHSVPRWGTEPFKALHQTHLKVPEATWQLFDPTRRGMFCVPIFRIVRSRGSDGLRVAGVLAADTREPTAFLRSEIQRAIKDYAAVIQDVLEPVHGLQIREIAASGAAPLETILVNGSDPRIPPIERIMTVTAAPADAG
ncbi:MAG: serine/threonine-protein kinase [Planctomycetota bacterium]|jgi:hypothetical protein